MFQQMEWRRAYFSSHADIFIQENFFEELSSSGE